MDYHPAFRSKVLVTGESVEYMNLRYVKKYLNFHGEPLPHLILQQLVPVKDDSSYGGCMEWRNIPVVEDDSSNKSEIDNG